MSDNKKYYYLKLKDNFYNTEDVKLLESMQNGYEYSSLYLKLCLLSLKGEGILLYKNRIPYKPEMLSTITGHSVEVIEYSIPLFKELEMLTILDNGTIFIDDIQNLVGHGSTEAERKATYRKKINDQKLIGQCPGQNPPEKEIEREKETDKKKENIVILYDEKKLKECFDVWISCELPLLDWETAILHINDTITSNLDKYNMNEAILNYNLVLNQDRYMYTFRWMFWSFLDKGFKKFLTQSNPFEAFKDITFKEEDDPEEEMKRIQEAL